MTELLYLNDTRLNACEAQIVDTGSYEGKPFVALDRTIFYPQGGGQPADHGIITANGTQFRVNNVRLTSEGSVLHFGDDTFEGLQKGAAATLEIDQARRWLNARLHSAGHLIDVAVSRVGIQGLVPTKGYHFPDSPYVEYDGVLENPAAFVDRVNEELQALIAQNLAFHCVALDADQAKERGISAPPGKSARFVYIGDFEALGCGCGGTHVERSLEIGSASVRKISSKKGVTRVSYVVV